MHLEGKGLVIRRRLGFGLLLLLAAGALVACPKYARLRGDDYHMPIEAVSSSAEAPIELCGMDEVMVYFEWLRCANGQPVFRSGAAGLDSLDRDYESKTAQGARVVRYQATCYLKTYDLYIAPEVCEAGRRPNIPFAKPKAAPAAASGAREVEK